MKLSNQNLWQTKCKELLLPDSEAPNQESLEVRFDYLRRTFPRAKKFLDWWHTSDIEAMVFKLRTRRPEDDPPLSDEDTDDEVGGKKKKRLAKTTNAQESLHRVYYMLWSVLYLQFDLIDWVHLVLFQSFLIYTYTDALVYV